MTENLKIPELSQWENLTADDLFHPTFQYYSRWFMDIIFVISLILYSFAVYVIFTKSTPAMGLFKYTVFCQLTSNFALHTYIFVVNPIFGFPLTLLSNYSHFPIKVESVHPMFAIVLLFIIASVAAFVLSLSIRVYAVFNNKFSTVSSLKIVGILIFYIFVTIFTWSTIAIPFLLSQQNPYQVQQIFEANIPAVIELYKIYPATGGFILNQPSTNFFISLFFILLLFWIFVMFCVLFILHYLFIWKLKKLKNIVSKETYSLQKMLYRILVIQLFNALIFAALPAAVIFIGFFIQKSIGSWLSNCVIPVATLHINVDVICLIYFVKPYKKFVTKKLLKNRRAAVHGITVT